MIIGFDRDAIRGPKLTVENVRKYFPKAAGLTDDQIEELVIDRARDEAVTDPFDEVGDLVDWAVDAIAAAEL